jgi:MinD superfamily P-loop ATPase
MDFIQVNQEKCTKCGICVDICPPRILKMKEKGPSANESQACIACGHCIAICPHAAIDNIKTPLAHQIALEEFPVISAETAHHYLRSRRSVRCYKDERVPRNQLLKLVDIARFAPTASNKQGISYIIVDDDKILKKPLKQ